MSDKFCVDCKWFKKNSFLEKILSFGECRDNSCLHKESEISLVNKEYETEEKYYVYGKGNSFPGVAYNSAKTMRLYGPCGRQGKLFEQKEVAENKPYIKINLET
jgi:hypothetical protein